jgi:hypothetical protein
MFDEEQSETDSERLDRLEALVIDQFWTTTIMQDLVLAIWTMIFEQEEAAEKLEAMKELLYTEAGQKEWLEKYKDVMPGKTPEETANFMVQGAFRAINKMIAIVTPK